MITVKLNDYKTTVGPASLDQPQPLVSGESAFGITMQNLILNSSPESTTTEAALPATNTPIGGDLKNVNLATSPLSIELKNFITWQGAQQSPIMPCTIAEVWSMQGIQDPLTDPTILSQARDTLAHSQARTALDPSYTAEWAGDWQTRMSQNQNAEAARQAQLAAMDAINHVVVGGGPING